MKTALKIVWLLIPIGLLAYHFGPGQGLLARDRAKSEMDRGLTARNDLDWNVAASSFEQAISELPEDSTRLEQWRLSLSQARALIQGGQMIEGQELLQETLLESETTEQNDSDLARSIRSDLAASSYFSAWIMRLEGATPEEWKPESERARQQFRLLAERTEKSGAKEQSLLHKKNLEATVRLEQMDLTELLARPLPKNCPDCQNLSQRKRKQSKSRSKGKGKGEGEKDSREKVNEAQGAGINKREGSGS